MVATCRDVQACVALAASRSARVLGVARKVVQADRWGHRVRPGAVGRVVLRLRRLHRTSTGESVDRAAVRGPGCQGWFRAQVRDCRSASTDAEARKVVHRARQVLLPPGARPKADFPAGLGAVVAARPWAAAAQVQAARVCVAWQQPVRWESRLVTSVLADESVSEQAPLEQARWVAAGRQAQQPLALPRPAEAVQQAAVQQLVQSADEQPVDARQSDVLPRELAEQEARSVQPPGQPEVSLRRGGAVLRQQVAQRATQQAVRLAEPGPQAPPGACEQPSPPLPLFPSPP